MVNLSLCCTGTWHASERKKLVVHTFTKGLKLLNYFLLLQKSQVLSKMDCLLGRSLKPYSSEDKRGKIPFTVNGIFFPDACCMMMDGVWERHSMRQCATATVNVKA
jgi:hypothetical protein